MELRVEPEVEPGVGPGVGQGWSLGEIQKPAPCVDATLDVGADSIGEGE